VLGLVTLQERHHCLDMKQIHQILHGSEIISKRRGLVWTVTEREKRDSWQDSGNIRPQAAHLVVRKYFFSHQVVSSWNQIP
jgi:hypothetical protein